MKHKKLQKVPQLQFSNSWEDPGILLEALKPKEGQRILSVAAAGDNTLALLGQNPEEITAIDPNISQIFLLELKKAAIQLLSQEEVLLLLGYTQSEKRLELFESIKYALSSPCRAFWEKKKVMIRKGLIYQGRFEQYFSFFARKILPMIHSKEMIEELFRPKHETEQAYFYLNHWNSFKWRLAFKLFFNKYMISGWGKQVEMLDKLELKIPIEDFLFQLAQKQICNLGKEKNPFLHFALKAKVGEELPYYLQTDNFSRIKANIDRLKLSQGNTTEILKSQAPFDLFNLSQLSNLRQGLKVSRLAKILSMSSPKEARIAYWNWESQAYFSRISPRKFHLQKNLSLDLQQKYQSFLYPNFITEVRI